MAPTGTLSTLRAPARDMQVLPSGLVVPPLPYAAALVVATAVLVVALVRYGPGVTGRHVVALVPWMAAGGALHALHQFDAAHAADRFDAVPELVDPLATAPAVYVTTFVAAAAVWVAAIASVDGLAVLTGGGGVSSPAADERAVRALGGVGALAVVGLLARAVTLVAGDPATLAVTWPAVGVLGALVVTAVAALVLRSYRPAVVGYRGTLVALFAHALDGVSTAIGVDVLGTGERTPIPRMIMDFAGTLPTATYIGRGWLFVLAKLVVAGGIVVLLADYVEEDPTEGNLLLAFVAAVGLGPAANNLTLFLLNGVV
jgi:uncharacterized membrane protein